MKNDNRSRQETGQKKTPLWFRILLWVLVISLVVVYLVF